MSHKRSRVSAKSSGRLLNFAHARSSRMEAEELLNEIDNLALLLHEVKKQTDRIEAAADAIGDAILSRLDSKKASPMTTSPTRQSPLPIQPRASQRLRTMPARSMQLSDLQA